MVSSGAFCFVVGYLYTNIYSQRLMGLREMFRQIAPHETASAAPDAKKEAQNADIALTNAWAAQCASGESGVVDQSLYQELTTQVGEIAAKFPTEFAQLRSMSEADAFEVLDALYKRIQN